MDLSKLSCYCCVHRLNAVPAGMAVAICSSRHAVLPGGACNCFMRDLIKMSGRSESVLYDMRRCIIPSAERRGKSRQRAHIAQTQGFHRQEKQGKASEKSVNNEFFYTSRLHSFRFQRDTAGKGLTTVTPPVSSRRFMVVVLLLKSFFLIISSITKQPRIRRKGKMRAAKFFHERARSRAINLVCYDRSVRTLGLLQLRHMQSIHLDLQSRRAPQMTEGQRAMSEYGCEVPRL